MKILIGFHCNIKQNEFAGMIMVREHLNLIPHNIQQPAIEATAVITGTHHLEISKQASTDKTIEPWHCSIEKIQNGISAVLLAGNPNAYIDHVDQKIKSSLASPLSNIFDGHIVYGITNEREANYIRSQGGVMLHVSNTSAPTIIQHDNNDLVTHVVGNGLPSEISIFTLTRLINKKFFPEQQEAA